MVGLGKPQGPLVLRFCGMLDNMSFEQAPGDTPEWPHRPAGHRNKDKQFLMTSFLSGFRPGPWGASLEESPRLASDLQAPSQVALGSLHVCHWS